jgi:hypothetical protein
MDPSHLDLSNQWQVTSLWMCDANAVKRARRCVIGPVAAREIATAMLDKYFDMVEKVLECSVA